MTATTYSNYIEADDKSKSMQIVVCLPQSKIGYTYPEVYFCIPCNNRLNYIGLDTIIKRTWQLDEEEQMWFLNQYSQHLHENTLTDDIWNELHLFSCSMKQLLEVLYNDLIKEEQHND